MKPFMPLPTYLLLMYQASKIETHNVTNCVTCSCLKSDFQQEMQLSDCTVQVGLHQKTRISQL